MKKVASVEEYIENNQKWSEALIVLREIVNSTELVETIKWNIPTYTINNKNVLGIGAFKNHFGIWFFNGVFLKDKYNLLRNAQDGKTKAMRQLNFTSLEDVDTNIVLQYVKEAIENQKENKEIGPNRSKKQTIVPVELHNILESNSSIKDAFYALTPYKQREYCEYIATAKRITTKQSRLEKIKPLILKGKGLHDKYKNC